MEYGLTVTNQNYIMEKAKSKKDGIYQARGVHYLVIDGRAIHFITVIGDVFEYSHGFNVQIGKCEALNDTVQRDTLKDLWKLRR